MLPSENFYGNIEYKRYILPKDSLRYIQLGTQMNWRLNEGNGIAYYYIGVDDDGKIVNISNFEWEQTKKNIKIISDKINAIIISIENFELNKDKYYVIKIKKKIKLYKNEKRILLLGDTLTGKTSFLAYIIKKKLGDNAKLYMHLHKHELESGKTSSFNYHQIRYNNTRLVFIDTPGDKNFHKTRQKIVSSIEFDLVLIFYKYKLKWEYEPYYQKLFHLLNIPVLRINLFANKNRFPKINLKKPVSSKKIISYIFKNLKIEEPNNSNNLLFNIISSYPHKDMGLILSGYLKSGCIKKNQIVNFYSNNKYTGIIKSLHIDNKPINIIKKKSIFTVLLNIKEKYNKKPVGFLSNKKYRKKNKITMQLLYLLNELEDNIVCFFGNKIIKLNIEKKENNLIFCNVDKNNNIYNLKRINNIILGYNFIGKLVEV